MACPFQVKLKEVVLENFRSYQREQVGSWSPGVNTIVGLNGAGKSNLLKALLFCLTDSYHVRSKHRVEFLDSTLTELTSADGRDGLGVRVTVEVVSSSGVTLDEVVFERRVIATREPAGTEGGDGNEDEDGDADGDADEDGERMGNGPGEKFLVDGNQVSFRDFLIELSRFGFPVRSEEFFVIGQDEVFLTGKRTVDMVYLFQTIIPAEKVKSTLEKNAHRIEILSAYPGVGELTREIMEHLDEVRFFKPPNPFLKVQRKIDVLKLAMCLKEKMLSEEWEPEDEDLRRRCKEFSRAIRAHKRAAVRYENASVQHEQAQKEYEAKYEAWKAKNEALNSAFEHRLRHRPPDLKLTLGDVREAILPSIFDPSDNIDIDNIDIDGEPWNFSGSPESMSTSPPQSLSLSQSQSDDSDSSVNSSSNVRNVLGGFRMSLHSCETSLHEFSRSFRKLMKRFVDDMAEFQKVGLDPFRPQPDAEYFVTSRASAEIHLWKAKCQRALRQIDFDRLVACKKKLEEGNPKIIYSRIQDVRAKYKENEAELNRTWKKLIEKMGDSNGCPDDDNNDDEGSGSEDSRESREEGSSSSQSLLQICLAAKQIVAERLRLEHEIREIDDEMGRLQKTLVSLGHGKTFSMLSLFREMVEDLKGSVDPEDRRLASSYLGPVADFIDFTEPYHWAVSAVLGQRVFHPVIKTEKDAFRLAEKFYDLYKDRYPQGLVYQLVDQKGDVPPDDFYPERAELRELGAMKRLLPHVTCPTLDDPDLLHTLFSGVIVVRDMDDAVSLVEEAEDADDEGGAWPSRVVWVDPGGQLFGRTGLLSPVRWREGEGEDEDEEEEMPPPTKVWREMKRLERIKEEKREELEGLAEKEGDLEEQKRKVVGETNDLAKKFWKIKDRMPRLERSWSTLYKKYRKLKLKELEIDAELDLLGVLLQISKRSVESYQQAAQRTPVKNLDILTAMAHLREKKASFEKLRHRIGRALTIQGWIRCKNSVSVAWPVRCSLRRSQTCSDEFPDPESVKKALTESFQADEAYRQAGKDFAHAKMDLGVARAFLKKMTKLGTQTMREVEELEQAENALKQELEQRMNPFLVIRVLRQEEEREEKLRKLRKAEEAFDAVQSAWPEDDLFDMADEAETLALQKTVNQIEKALGEGEEKLRKLEAKKPSMAEEAAEFAQKSDEVTELYREKLALAEGFKTACAEAADELKAYMDELIAVWNPALSRVLADWMQCFREVYGATQGSGAYTELRVEAIDSSTGALHFDSFQMSAANLEDEESSSFDDSVEEMSAGQRSLLAFSLIVSLYSAASVPLCILDEVDQSMDKRVRDLVAACAVQIARDRGMQFLLTTFSPSFIHVADKCFMVTKDDSVSRVAPVSIDEAKEFVSDALGADGTFSQLQSI